MRTMSIVAGLVLATAAASASAQYYRYDGYRDRAPISGEQECWNPRAGHFERLRPGEYQDDLDLRRCRMIGYGDRFDRYERRDERRDWRERREECWNPRAGHFEEVRRGEHQDDLDFRRCRIARD